MFTSHHIDDLTGFEIISLPDTGNGMSSRAYIGAMILAAGLAIAARPARAQSYLVQGALNLHTGLFQPRIRNTQPEATSTYSGTFDVTISITLVTSIPTTQPIGCSAEISGTDATYAQHDEQANVVATRSGSTATCTLAVPYSWSLGTTPTYTFGYTVTTAASSGTPSRTSSVYSETGATVPAKGTTTKLAAAVTL